MSPKGNFPRFGAKIEKYKSLCLHNGYAGAQSLDHTWLDIVGAASPIILIIYLYSEFDISIVIFHLMLLDFGHVDYRIGSTGVNSSRSEHLDPQFLIQTETKHLF